MEPGAADPAERRPPGLGAGAQRRAQPDGLRCPGGRRLGAPLFLFPLPRHLNQSRRSAKAAGQSLVCRATSTSASTSLRSTASSFSLA